jgi:hypothetical protein
LSEAGRSGVHGRVDAILAELGLATTVDADGDWAVESDVGPFLLVIEKGSEDLVFIQTLQRLEGGPEGYAGEMHALLLLNMEAEGAAFAALRDRESDLLVIASRVGHDRISRESVEKMLDDAMRLSRRLDELAAA